MNKNFNKLRNRVKSTSTDIGEEQSMEKEASQIQELTGDQDPNHKEMEANDENIMRQEMSSRDDLSDQDLGLNTNPAPQPSAEDFIKELEDNPAKIISKMEDATSFVSTIVSGLQDELLSAIVSNEEVAQKFVVKLAYDQPEAAINSLLKDYSDEIIEGLVQEQSESIVQSLLNNMDDSEEIQESLEEYHKEIVKALLSNKTFKNEVLSHISDKTIIKKALDLDDVDELLPLLEKFDNQDILDYVLKNLKAYKKLKGYEQLTEDVKSDLKITDEEKMEIAKEFISNLPSEGLTEALDGLNPDTKTVLMNKWTNNDMIGFIVHSHPDEVADEIKTNGSKSLIDEISSCASKEKAQELQEYYGLNQPEEVKEKDSDTTPENFVEKVRPEFLVNKIVDLHLENNFAKLLADKLSSNDSYELTTQLLEDNSLKQKVMEDSFDEFLEYALTNHQKELSEIIPNNYGDLMGQILDNAPHEFIENLYKKFIKIETNKKNIGQKKTFTLNINGKDQKFSYTDIEELFEKKGRRSSLDASIIASYNEQVEDGKLLSIEDFRKEQKKLKQSSLPIAEDILDYVCRSTMKSLEDKFKSETYTQEYTKKLLEDYVVGDTDAENPLFKALVEEIVAKKVIDDYLGNKSEAVFKYIGKLK